MLKIKRVPIDEIKVLLDICGVLGIRPRYKITLDFPWKLASSKSEK